MRTGEILIPDGLPGEACPRRRGRTGAILIPDGLRAALQAMPEVQAVDMHIQLVVRRKVAELKAVAAFQGAHSDGLTTQDVEAAVGQSWQDRELTSDASRKESVPATAARKMRMSLDRDQARLMGSHRYP